MNVYYPDGIGDNRIGFNTYMSWYNGLRDNFKYIYQGGYYPETTQAAIKIMFNKNDELIEQQRELELFLPFIKPVKDKKGEMVQRIYLFEHSLSEHGVYYLDIYNYGNYKYEVKIMSYHNESLVQRFDLLETALEYIRKNHYYE